MLAPMPERRASPTASVVVASGDAELGERPHGHRCCLHAPGALALWTRSHARTPRRSRSCPGARPGGRCPGECDHERGAEPCDRQQAYQPRPALLRRRRARVHHCRDASTTLDEPVRGSHRRISTTGSRDAPPANSGAPIELRSLGRGSHGCRANRPREWRPTRRSHASERLASRDEAARNRRDRCDGRCPDSSSRMMRVHRGVSRSGRTARWPASVASFAARALLWAAGAPDMFAPLTSGKGLRIMCDGREHGAAHERSTNSFHMERP